MKLAFTLLIYILSIYIHENNSFQYRSIQLPKQRKSALISIFSTRESTSLDLETIEEQALIKRINEEVLRDTGVELEQLINPSKVVNLERENVKLAKKLSSPLPMNEKKKYEAKIESNKNKILVEKRAVMRSWLKNLFIAQSVIAGVISLLMVYNALPGYSFPLAVQVLGFWMWWLFIIPSLRARKPTANEKEALNIAFLATPLVSISLPFITKDIPTIWWANVATVAICYGYAFLRPQPNFDAEDVESETDDSSEDWLIDSKTGKANSAAVIFKKAFRALDYGSGRERGRRQ